MASQRETAVDVSTASGDWVWMIAIVGGPILLAIAFIYGMVRRRHRRSRPPEPQAKVSPRTGRGDAR